VISTSGGKQHKPRSLRQPRTAMHLAEIHKLNQGHRRQRNQERTSGSGLQMRKLEALRSLQTIQRALEGSFFSFFTSIEPKPSRCYNRAVGFQGFLAFGAADPGDVLRDSGRMCWEGSLASAQITSKATSLAATALFWFRNFFSKDIPESMVVETKTFVQERRLTTWITFGTGDGSGRRPFV
jgi:hypothetical protein